MHPEQRLRVFVADDSPLFRRSLALSIEAHSNLEIAGQADDGRRALELIEQLDPDVCVLDMRIPSLDGLSVVAGLHQAQLRSRAVLLSAHIDGELVHRALAAGAAGCLDKDAPEREITDAIIGVGAGQTVVSHRLQALLAAYLRRPVASPVALSRREREVLDLASHGHTARQIARDLSLSPESVRTFQRRACDKLGVKGQTAAVAAAVRRGLL